MITAIRAEFRKVFSVRSTYVLLAFVAVLLVFFSFYVGGWHTDATDLRNPTRLFKLDSLVVNFLAIFPSIMGMLLFTHEFRYNTISYSLTLSNKRFKVLLSKIFVVSVLALSITAIAGVLAPLLAKWGMSANHLHLAKQQFNVGSMVWHGLAYGWGEAMIALAIAALIRNQIGAIVTFLIVPGTVEGLLSIWLKSKTVYLPFSALHSVLNVDNSPGNGYLSPLHGLLVFLAYLVVAWVVAWYMFIKRDAS